MTKEPGDWYGVNSIAQVLSDLFLQREKDAATKKPSTKLRHEVFNGLSVLTFSDGQMYLDQIIEKIKEGFKQPEQEEVKLDCKDSSYVMIDELNIKEV